MRKKQLKNYRITSMTCDCSAESPHFCTALLVPEALSTGLELEMNKIEYV